jgi:hypothetical protein
VVGSSTARTEYGRHLPADFLAQIRVLPNGCHEWTGKVNDSGYGVYRGQLAHRFVAGAERPIPPGYVVDHTCHTRACTAPGKTDPHRRCVNRAHLEPVTNAENVRRGRWAAATEASRLRAGRCDQGHEKVPGRQCNTCRRERRAAGRRLRNIVREGWNA